MHHCFNLKNEHILQDSSLHNGNSKLLGENSSATTHLNASSSLHFSFDNHRELYFCMSGMPDLCGVDFLVFYFNVIIVICCYFRTLLG